MSIKKQKFHRKGKRVLAQFRPGTITKIRTFNLAKQQYVYLVHVKLDDDPESEFKFMPQDIEELEQKNINQ